MPVNWTSINGSDGSFYVVYFTIIKKVDSFGLWMAQCSTKTFTME